MTATPARYPGVCPECGGRWQPDDLIRAVADWDGADTWVHAACPEPANPDDIRPGEVACPDCWLIHPRGKCDR